MNELKARLRMAWAMLKPYVVLAPQAILEAVRSYGSFVGVALVATFIGVISYFGFRMKDRLYGIATSVSNNIPSVLFLSGNIASKVRFAMLCLVVIAVIVTILVNIDWKAVTVGGKEPRWKRFLKHNALQLSSMWFFLTVVLPLTTPNFTAIGADGKEELVFSLSSWWWKHLSSTYGGVIAIGFIMAGMMVYHDDKDPFRYKLAKFKIGFLVFVSLWYLFLLPNMGTWIRSYELGSLDPFTLLARTTTSTLTRTPRPNTGVIQTQVMKFWYDNLPGEEAWNKVDTTRAESGFRQWDQNGNVLRSPTNDLGVEQINEPTWGKIAQELGHDLSTIQGQLNMALYIYNKRGITEWDGWTVVQNLEVKTTVTVAPVGNWSEVYRVEPFSSCFWSVDREVLARLDSGEQVKFLPGKITFFDSSTLVYQVIDGEPGKVTVKCRQ